LALIARADQRAKEMMMVSPDRVFPGPSNERLQRIESGYGVELPASYRAFLHEFNGAVFDDGVEFPAMGRLRLLERFLPIFERPREEGAVGWYDVTVVLSQIDDRLIDDAELVGTNILPIAELFAGDFVCLDYRGGKAEPVVVAWDHELSSERCPVVAKIADSFSDFLVLLDGH
jgi:hypothetical protein